MKKIRLSILIILFALMFVTHVWAAGSSISISGDSVIRSPVLDRYVFRVITIIFTADDTNGAIPDLTLNASTAGLAYGSPAGWFGYSVFIDCNHAGVEPTENSELYILNAVGGDMLGGQGVDQVDNTIERHVYFHNGTAPVKQPMIDTWTVRITQQAVATNSATGTIKIILVSD
jgi:hypothetical protein